MSIELRVTGRLQQSMMSCWWTAVACVLEYYGRFYRSPSAYSSVFDRPLTRSPTSIGYETPTLDDAMRIDPTLRNPALSDRLAPYEWYFRGLPSSGWGLRRLCSVTGFRGVPDCPQYGRWTAADFERILRARGPIVFHGYWNGYGHSIVVCGINNASGIDSVVQMDPAMGFVSSDPMDHFNERMARMTIGQDAMGYNPIYKPDSEPVRAVV